MMGEKLFLCLLAAIATATLAFYGLGFSLDWIDQSVGYREVKEFLENHKQIKDDWLSNPNIHSISFSHDPEMPSRLQIQFDVEDKHTFLMIEDVLFQETLGMTFPPLWKTELRSKERLGMSLGFAGQGIGEAGKGIGRFFDCLFFAILSFLSAFVIAIWVAFRRPKAKARLNDGGTKLITHE